MATAYVVTQGEYSDYKVLAVFTTEELADQFLAFFPEHGYSYPCLEEYTLDEMLDYPKGKLAWLVKIYRDGGAVCEQRSPDCVKDFSRLSPGCLDDDRMWAHVWAKDKKHAIKITNELRAQAIANDEWETDYRKWQKKQPQESPW